MSEAITLWISLGVGVLAAAALRAVARVHAQNPDRPLMIGKKGRLALWGIVGVSAAFAAVQFFRVSASFE
jgi:hypothetical protein